MICTGIAILVTFDYHVIDLDRRQVVSPHIHGVRQGSNGTVGRWVQEGLQPHNLQGGFDTSPTLSPKCAMG